MARLPIQRYLTAVFVLTPPEKEVLPTELEVSSVREQLGLQEEMDTMKTRWFNVVLVACLLVLGLVPAGSAYAVNGGKGSASADSPSTGPRVDTSSALVQLKGAPLSTYVKTKPAQGKKIDFSSATVKSYRAQLSAQRNQFKQWLQANAPKAKITGQYDISLNAVAVQLNGTKLGLLATAPMAKHVEYEGLYYPTYDDPDLNIISAFAAWDEAGGSANAGAGVKVAIIDTGIDITHPCFSDAGLTAQPRLGQLQFTNNKVIVAKVFNNKTPGRGYTAEALQEHGTHVAGTVACNFDTAASVDGVEIPHGISGVAPAALLGNYNIFPADVTNARSEDILNALEAAYADGFDVANMSLGGNAHGIQDLLSMGVNNLDAANMVIAVAAGNSGPGHYTVESPGSAISALTAGASTVGHFIGTPITAGGSNVASAAGDFATVTADLTAPLGAVTVTGTDELDTACLALPAGSLVGQIALVSRGACSFSIKIRNAQAAGAVAAVVGNNVAGDPIAMGQDGTANQPTIPAYMVSLADAGTLKGFNGTDTTISATKAYLETPNSDFMAGFSSQGPTDVDFRVKPDVVAPGVNVLSSIPSQFCAEPPCFAFFQGTSMATPHLAGSAAVVKGQHPGWSAAQIRSAIVNTADQGVLQPSSGTDPLPDVNITGAGRENLLSAVNASVALNPVSVSFGAVPSGAGQTSTFVLTLTNLSAPATFDVAVGAGGGGVSFSVEPTTLTLGAAGSGTVTVTMSAAKGAVLGDHSATLTVSSEAGEVAHAAVYTFIK
jgi:minor extracellular serine protease Vpr